jgi:hypothetical protein
MASPESFSVLGIEQLSIEKYKNDGKNNYVTTQKPLVNCPMRGLKRRKTVHLNLSYQHFWGSCE